MNDIKNEILEKLKDRTTRDFKYQTEEMCRHKKKLKDENEDLRNRSMWSTLIFPEVPKNKQSDAWEDVSRHLVSLLSSRLNLNYDELDLKLSNSHRSPKTTEDNDTRPIFAAFVNWCYADDIRESMIRFYAERKSKITVSQMFSKELTQRQNEALKKRKKIFQESPELNIYLEFPTRLMAKKKMFIQKAFCFRNFHSINHAFVSITEEKRQALDEDEFACGVFLDFQKAFNTVNHNMLIAKLNQYGIRGITLDCFQP